MNRYWLFRTVLPVLLLMGCGDAQDPMLAGSPDSPVVLDSTNGDSVLAYHPTMPDSLATNPGTLVQIDTTVRYQTMSGWEAHTEAGFGMAGFDVWKAGVMNLAANDLGINRLRLEILAGAENPVDYAAQEQAGLITAAAARAQRYVAVNDNSDPNSMNSAGFKWTHIDQHVRESVLPIKQKLEARGERLYLNLCYVAFSGGGTIHGNPAEYAELLLATLIHLRDQFGLTVDGIEVILEPDNGTIWKAPAIGRAIAAAGARLAAAGFHPEFIAASVVDASHAVPYLNDIVAQPGATTYLKEVSYHRYLNASDATVAGIGARATQLGLRTSMLEHIGSGVDNLYKDLTLGGVSAWQQFALAFPTSDNGAQYYTIAANQPVLASRTRLLRQYFKYIRRGAVRVASSSNLSGLRSVAFLHPSMGATVVVHPAQAGTIGIRGLPPGRYGVTMATSTTSSTLADVTAGPEGSVVVSVPSAGVATLFRR